MSRLLFGEFILFSFRLALSGFERSLGNATRQGKRGHGPDDGHIAVEEAADKLL
jgi:hypothetical protein